MKERWTSQQANEWYAKQGWLRGCNFIGSDCANRLDMFQRYRAEEKLATAERELALCQKIGFNTVRIWLSFDVYYAVGSGYENEMLCSIVFDKEEGEDKYSITRTMEGSTHKQKFIVSTKKPIDASNPEDVLKGGGSPKDAIKDGVNKALNKINVFKKKK